MSFRSTLLASEVPLDDAIHYSVYHPTEQTRRIIQSANGDKPLRESWLHSTSEDDALFVFRIGVPREEELEQLELDVAPTEQRTFSPGEIYGSKESSLKVVWNQFVSAVTSRLVDDIVRSAPTTSSSSSSSVSVYRMKKHGFVMGHKTLSNEWTVGWEYRAKSRPLVHTHLQLLLSTSSRPSLVIHPLLTVTPFLLLPDAPSSPTQGDPLTLLPFGTPAYFLHNYTASTSAITAQFRDAFKGLGNMVGDWEAGFNSNTQDRGIGFGKGKGRADTTYIIAYIPLQNRAQGQTQLDGSDTPDQHAEKGLTVIYPSRLCMAFISPQSAAEAGRVPLPPSKFPVLPAPLQPSPLVPPMLPPGPNVANTSNNTMVTSAATPTAMATPFSPGTPPVPRSANAPGPLRVSTPVGMMTMGPQTATTPMNSRDLAKFGFEFSFSTPSTPYTAQTQQTLKAFRNLVLKRSLSGPAIPKANTSTSSGTPHQQDHSSPQPSTPAATSVARAGIGADSRTLHHVAGQVSDYVDAVAKERERERERMRQQQLQQNQQTTPSSASTPGLRVGPQQSLSTSVSTTLRSAPIPVAHAQMGNSISTTAMPASASSRSLGILSTPASVSVPPVAGAQIGGLTQQQLQNFYPSPPQSNQMTFTPNRPSRSDAEGEAKKHVPPPLDLKAESEIMSNPPTTILQNAGNGQDYEMVEFEQVDVKMEAETQAAEVDNVKEERSEAAPPQSNTSATFSGLNDTGVFGGLPGMEMGMGMMDDMMGLDMMGMNGIGDMGMMDMNWSDMNWSFDNNTATVSSTTVSNTPGQATVSATIVKANPSPTHAASSGLTHSRNSSGSTPHPIQAHHPTHASHPIVQDFEADFTEDDFDFFDKPANSGAIDFGLSAVENHSHLGVLAGSASGSGPGPPNSANYHPLQPSPPGFAGSLFHSTSGTFQVPNSSPTHSAQPNVHTTHMQAHGHPTPISTMPSPWPPGSMSHPTPGAAGATPSVQGIFGFLSPGQTPMEEVGVITDVDVDVHLDGVHRTAVNRGRFAPIVFGKRHHEADGKYKDRTGKFSAFTVRNRGMLPSPPWGSDDERDSARRRNDKSRRNSRRGRALTRNSKVSAEVWKAGSGSKNKNTTSWQVEYDHATDPRYKVVKILVGMKRKAEDPAYGSGTRNVSTRSKRWQAIGKPPLSPTSIFSDSDLDPDDEDGNSDSGSTSSSDNEEELDDTMTTVTDDPPPSRPTTPPPSYLPLGPSLLQTGFKFEKLLPLSVPLAGGSNSSNSSQTVPSTTGPMGLTPISVPTPVSPEAIVEDETERISKSFEAAAEMVAREVVNNCVWAEAWGNSNVERIGDSEGGDYAGTWNKISRGGVIGFERASLHRQEVWPADIKLVADLLNGVRGVEGPLILERLYEQDTSPSKSSPHTLSPLEPPMISIGKGDAIIQVVPTALRFWEKLGLGPRGGKKDVTAFVLFEDNGEWRQQQVEIWLSNLAALYNGKNLGRMLPGRSSFCPKNGLLPLRLDPSFHKTLANFVASLPAPRSNFVFFLVTPSYAMSLASPLLQQVLFSIKQALKTYSEAQIVFQFIPESMILGSTDVSSPQDMGTSKLCCSIYDRILRAVDRTMSRRFFENGERVRNYFQEPVFTLAKAPHENKVTYSYSPNASLDVLDHHLLLHVGYQVSHCGKWLLAACVDQRGEAHDVGLWLVDDLLRERNPKNELSYDWCLVSKVWDFAMQFADKANVEWRVAFAKLEEIKSTELDAWSSLFDTRRASRAVYHVSLFCVQTSSPWIFFPDTSKTSLPNSSLTRTLTSSAVRPQTPSLIRSASTSSTKSSSRNQIFVDMSTTMYALYQKDPLPLSMPPTLEDLGLAHGVVTVSTSGPENHLLPLPLCSSMLLRAPSMPTTSLNSTSPSTTSSASPATASTTTTSFSSHAQLHIHLHIVKPPQCSINGLSDRQHHRDVTQSYHGLAMLSVERWHLNPGNSLLPFHLAAVAAMKNALSPGGEYNIDMVDST